MTLQIRAAHNIRSMHEEPTCAHIQFRNEDGMRQFIDDNRIYIRTLYERWSVDWEPLLTVTSK